MSETPAEVIRRAAALMRERAEAATQGPWQPVAGIWGEETATAVITREGDPADPRTWLMATGCGPGSRQKANANHAASWHPLVAQVVASWLESLDGIDFSECGPMTEEIAYALKIARAYLGEETP